MNDSILCFVEGKDENIGDLKSNLLNTFRTMPYKVIYEGKNHRFHFSVCGFMVVNDQPIVIFPKNYPLPQSDSHLFGTDEIKTDAELLLRTFRRYRSQIQSDKGWKERNAETGIDEEEKIDEDEENFITGIEDILYILDDYRQYGYLARRHTVISQTKPGRTMWNKTIRQTTPLISHGNALYASPYMKSNVRHDEEMVQKIHRYLVDKFRRQWGWILGMGADSDEIVKPCEAEDAKKILSNELSTCYVQREIDLLRHMLQFYRKKLGSDKEKRFDYMLTSKAEQIWENMCGFCFGNVREKYKNNGIIPEAEFQKAIPTTEDSEKSKKWKQRPDIICKRKDDIYILDAKYYPLVVNDAEEEEKNREKKDRNFPGWADIMKQFVYAYAIRKMTDVKANVLLFPGEYSDKFKYLGDVNLRHVDDFDKIQFWSINVRDMLEAYTRNSKGCMAEEFFRLVDDKEQINQSSQN